MWTLRIKKGGPKDVTIKILAGDKQTSSSTSGTGKALFMARKGSSSSLCTINTDETHDSAIELPSPSPSPTRDSTPSQSKNQDQAQQAPPLLPEIPVPPRLTHMIAGETGVRKDKWKGRQVMTYTGRPLPAIPTPRQVEPDVVSEEAPSVQAEPAAARQTPQGPRPPPTPSHDESPQPSESTTTTPKAKVLENPCGHLDTTDSTCSITIEELQTASTVGSRQASLRKSQSQAFGLAGNESKRLSKSKSVDDIRWVNRLSTIFRRRDPILASLDESTEDDVDTAHSSTTGVESVATHSSGSAPSSHMSLDRPSKLGLTMTQEPEDMLESDSRHQRASNSISEGSSPAVTSRGSVPPSARTSRASWGVTDSQGLGAASISSDTDKSPDELLAALTAKYHQHFPSSYSASYTPAAPRVGIPAGTPLNLVGVSYTLPTAIVAPQPVAGPSTGNIEIEEETRGRSRRSRRHEPRMVAPDVDAIIPVASG
ncbi:hypothetical protein BC832DRAFT_486596 [Gaertneriomyces semiglobifer]|nr:hypothetical protein BC832DRAFT_486596 [Gaertneriomyces semiglobifer]